MTAIYQPLCKYFNLLSTSVAVIVYNTKYQLWYIVKIRVHAVGQKEPKNTLRNPLE